MITPKTGIILTGRRVNMVKFTSKIKEYAGNSVNFPGKKPLFIAPENIKDASRNFPPDTVVTVMVEKGTVMGMDAPTPAELRAYEQEQKATPKEETESFVRASKLPRVGDTKLPAPCFRPALCSPGCDGMRDPCPVKQKATVKPPVAAEIPAEPPQTQPASDPVPDKANTPPSPKKTPEERLRDSTIQIMPSERVGYRISLAGCVNSVIEAHKLTGDKPTMDQIKAEAVDLVIWMDGLTTRNIKGE
jgi:hypothetical protein